MVNGKDVNPFDITNDNHMYVEQNKVDLLRVLLNDKVKCNGCGYEFLGGRAMGYLGIAQWISDSCDPDTLEVLLHCGKCSHEGPFTMSPNPFMDVDKIDSYGALVTAYRKENDAWPTASTTTTTMKEVKKLPSKFLY